MLLRSLANFFVRTPLHPQWLLGRRVVPQGLTDVRGTLLDIGSGDSWLASHLDSGVRYISVDTPMTGKALYGSRPVIFADGMKLPFRDACIDAAVCLEVAEHVSNPQRLLSEINRVLKPGGLLFISVPFLYPIHDAPHDFQRFTCHGLRSIVETSGLEVLDIRSKAGSVRIAGTLACLAIIGPLAAGGWRLLLLPFAAMIVLAINLFAYVIGLFWPDWRAMTFGYVLRAAKPESHA